MNILAHLHLAILADSSIIGNLAADFVKGDPYLQFPQSIADGIMLHRRLDKLIDQMPTVKQAKMLFQPQHQRVAPITLDIVWDHFLSKHWHQFNADLNLATFAYLIKKVTNQQLDWFCHDFQQFAQHIWQGNWLINYADINFIAKVLRGMANRRAKLSILSNTINDVRQQYDELEAIFFNFYPDLMLKAKNKQI